MLPLMTPRLACLICVATLLGAPLALAQDDGDRTERSRRARALAGQLMSPFCPGRTLEDCPSPNAAAWREEIRGWIQAGVTEDEVVSRLQARTSTDLASVPRSPLGWTVPVAILLGGLLVLVWALRRVVATAPPVEIDEGLREELSRELEELEDVER